MDAFAVYQNPLVTRYAGRAMSELWSDRRRIGVWRRLWVALAEAEAELGADVSAEQIAELRAHVDDIDFAAAADYERRFRHDVMAHIHAYGDVAPSARPILHLGATSCYVTDNADLLLMREGLDLVAGRIASAMANLATFARAHRALPVMGFTHFQPAQLTTLGKRACLWLSDLLMDFEEIQHRRQGLRLRGAKGTTGTQASFLALFAGNHEKVRQLDRRIAEKMGFDGSYPVTGQTYSRKVDSQVLDALSGVCQSAHKFAVDLRLLAHRKEVEEPFESEQIGSSAMPYKRNPMRAERLCGLARYVQTLPAGAAATASTQWLERTLDDSAIRRIIVPQAFLGTDATLRLYENVTRGLAVYPKVIAEHVRAELPFMAAENVLLAGVRAGGDRQELHERFRRHSQDAANRVKGEGLPNDLIDRLRADPAFAAVDWEEALHPASYVGRAPEQVEEFLAEHVDLIIDHYHPPDEEDEIRV